MADSLKTIYQKDILSDSVELKILHAIAFNEGNPDIIIAYSKILLDKSQKQNNKKYVHNAYFHLGNANRLKGNYESAFDYYFEALNQAEKQKNFQKIGASSCAIGDTYAVIDDRQNAQIFYNKCISFLEEYGEELQLGIAYFNAGDNLLNQDKLDSALQFFNRASDIFDKNQYQAGQAYSIGNIGLTYAYQNKNELAEEKLKQSISMLENLGDAYGISAYLIHIADIYIEKDELWLGLEYANLAHEHATQMGYKEQIKDASLRLSKIYEAMNKSGQAFDYLKTYITYKDSLNNESIISKMAEMRREYELAQLKKKMSARTVENEPEEKDEHQRTYYALLLGVNDYKNNDENLEDLDKPLKDAESLFSTLTNEYAFDADKTIKIENPTRADIINALEAISATISEKDNLLIFYAGHGVWDEKLNIGYWLPSDARSSSKSNWISNSTVQDYIAGLPSKHTLLISDACFSGGIFKTRGMGNGGIDEYGFSKLYKLPSRKAMTSGTLSTVPDESQFMKFLIKRLKENDESYMTARQLFSSIEAAVLNNTGNVPQYGIIQNTGDEGGEFIFIRKETLNQN
ncbi:MAG: caspase family protein [Candidatus Cyclobacteriaceae bacterium M2_1C_046]